MGNFELENLMGNYEFSKKIIKKDHEPGAEERN